METAESNPAPEPQSPSTPPQPAPWRGRVLPLVVLALALVLGLGLLFAWTSAPWARRAETPRPGPAGAVADAPRVAQSTPTEQPSITQYTVEDGDTLGDIAVTYDTDVDSLLALNNLPDPDMLRIGQVLSVPSAPATAAATATETPPPDQGIYVVEEGDTISSIAEDLGVDPDDLIAANALTDPDLINEGMELHIPN